MNYRKQLQTVNEKTNIVLYLCDTEAKVMCTFFDGNQFEGDIPSWMQDFISTKQTILFFEQDGQKKHYFKWFLDKSNVVVLLDETQHTNLTSVLTFLITGSHLDDEAGCNIELIKAKERENSLRIKLEVEQLRREQDKFEVVKSKDTITDLKTQNNIQTLQLKEITAMNVELSKRLSKTELSSDVGLTNNKLTDENNKLTSKVKSVTDIAQKWESRYKQLESRYIVLHTSAKEIVSRAKQQRPVPAPAQTVTEPPIQTSAQISTQEPMLAQTSEGFAKLPNLEAHTNSNVKDILDSSLANYSDNSYYDSGDINADNGVYLYSQSANHLTVDYHTMKQNAPSQDVSSQRVHNNNVPNVNMTMNSSDALANEVPDNSLGSNSLDSNTHPNDMSNSFLNNNMLNNNRSIGNLLGDPNHDNLLNKNTYNEIHPNVTNVLQTDSQSANAPIKDSREQSLLSHGGAEAIAQDINPQTPSAHETPSTHKTPSAHKTADTQNAGIYFTADGRAMYNFVPNYNETNKGTSNDKFNLTAGGVSKESFDYAGDQYTSQAQDKFTVPLTKGATANELITGSATSNSVPTQLDNPSLSLGIAKEREAFDYIGDQYTYQAQDKFTVPLTKGATANELITGSATSNSVPTQLDNPSLSLGIAKEREAFDYTGEQYKTDNKKYTVTIDNIPTLTIPNADNPKLTIGLGGADTNFNYNGEKYTPTNKEIYQLGSVSNSGDNSNNRTHTNINKMTGEQQKDGALAANTPEVHTTQHTITPPNKMDRVISALNYISESGSTEHINLDTFASVTAMPTKLALVNTPSAVKSVIAKLIGLERSGRLTPFQLRQLNEAIKNY